MTHTADMPALEQLTRELTFVEKGLLGFEQLLDFELSAYEPGTPFFWLRSRQDENVAFIVMEPYMLLDDYSFDLPDEEMRLLNVSSAEEIFVLVVCTVPEDPLEMTANLLGPLIFNRQTNQGRQLILERNKFPVRFPVFDANLSEEPPAERSGEAS